MSVRIIHAPAPAQTLRRVEQLSLWLAHLRVALGLLVVAGLAASFTSTVYLQLALGRPPYKEFYEHALFTLLGLALLPIINYVLASTHPARRWMRLAIPAVFFTSLLLVLLVKISPLGVSDFGARRWLDIGIVKFQPSELLKVSLVLYLGQLLCWWRRPANTSTSAGSWQPPPQKLRSDSPDYYKRSWQASLELSRRNAIDKLTGLERLLTPSKYGLLGWLAKLGGRPTAPQLPLLACLLILMSMALTALQPDLGTTGLLLGVGLLTCFLAGVRAGDVAKFMATLVVLGALLLLIAPGFYGYAQKRLDTYFQLLMNHPVDDNDAGYQITQGRGAVVVGGLTGKGWLQSEQKMNRLPLSTKDFIYPVIVEELGSLGGVVVMLLFLYLALCGLALGWASGDPFNQTVIPALGFAVALQALVNIGTTLGTLPLSGLPLPFLSNGGTSLLVSMASIGLMYALARAELQAGDKELEKVFG